MTTSEETWKARDPDAQGIWWSEEDSKFVCQATVISTLPHDLLEDHPEDDITYWNMVYSNLHEVPEGNAHKAKAYCKDITLMLGQTPKISNDMLNVIGGLLYTQLATPNVEMGRYTFSPSTIGFYASAMALDDFASTKRILSSQVAYKDGSMWHHYCPYEAYFYNHGNAKVERRKLERLVYGKMIVLGNHPGGFGSCFMTHEQLLGHVRNPLFDDVISKNIPLEMVEFQ